jgi:xylose isomerase
MRTYLILKEKAQQWNDNADIGEILANIRATDSENGLGNFDSLLARDYNRKELSSKGLQYERLDQLTMDILFGVA